MHTPDPWVESKQETAGEWRDIEDSAGRLVATVQRRRDVALVIAAPEMCELLRDVLRFKLGDGIHERVERLVYRADGIAKG